MLGSQMKEYLHLKLTQYIEELNNFAQAYLATQ